MVDLTRREILLSGASAALGLYLPHGAAAHTVAPRSSIRLRASSHAHRRALEELRRRLHGPLLLPHDPEYAAASEPANTRFDRIHPIAAAVCADEQDIATCISWSREHEIDAVARTGGHSYAGYSTTRGLVIDLRRLKSITVHPDGSAEIGGGAINQDVFEATEDGDFMLPAGTCLGVGVGGLTLGGGIGYNTHWAGLTCDRLRSSRMITASGELVELDGVDHQDLLWASRGGAGGSFGINTRFTFELARIPVKEVSFYRFDYRGADDAAAVLSKFDQILQSAPNELNAVAMAQAGVVGGEGPREAIETFSRGQYLGPMSELCELVAPLLEVATPVKSTLQTMSFWEMQKMLAGVEATPHAFGDISRYSNAPLPAPVVDKVVDLLVRCPVRTMNNNGSFWSLGWIGGDVVNSVGRTDTAYVHRDMLTLLRATPVWEAQAPRSVGRDLVDWAKEVIATIVPYTPAESYQNFPNREIEDWPREYYAENFERLVSVKGRYDPDDFFHNLQSIPPQRRA